jgi:alcohol dehydrogenase
MRGVCFRGVGHVAVEDLADPVIETPRDAIVRVELAGLCGSDLHPFFGREVGLDPGTVMGHEFVGDVIAVGDSVQSIRVGDRVCAPFTTNCGSCFYCKCGLTARCTAGELFGWRSNGVGLHGCQATMVRVPLADATLMRVPEGMSDEMALLLGDNLSTGYFAAEGVGISDAGVYVVIGCGTVGLLAIVSAVQLGATSVLAIDPEPARLAIAKSLGAVTCSEPDELMRSLHERTDGRGADGVIELVGLPQAQHLAYQAIRPGGTMSVIGCHCSPHFSFSPSDAYNKNLTYRTGRCSARHYMNELAQTLVTKSIDLSWCVTHRFAIDEAVYAYEVFAGRKEGCVKAVLRM